MISAMETAANEFFSLAMFALLPLRTADSAVSSRAASGVYTLCYSPEMKYLAVLYKIYTITFGGIQQNFPRYPSTGRTECLTETWKCVARCI